MNQKRADENELSKQLCELYKEHVPGYLNNLTAAFEAGETKAMEDIAHKLGSVVGSMGDRESMRTLSRIEREDIPREELGKLIGQLRCEILERLRML